MIFAPCLFAGKVVLVTGAGGGVGSATARLLHGLGATLALTDNNAKALYATATPLKSTAMLADITSVMACEEIIARTLQKHGHLDAVVNAAGLWVEGETATATETDWTRCIDVNLKATFFMCARAIPALAATRGAIVNLSSDAGIVGNAGAAIYSASKGGVTLLSKSLARELAPLGIRVNALCPADIDTPMLAAQANAAPDPAAYRDRLLSLYPQGAQSRFLTPDEVAAQIAFLLSPAAAAITGSAVMMDFGLTAGY